MSASYPLIIQGNIPHRVRGHCNPALDGNVSSSAPAFRRGVGCSLVPFTCALASCSVCAQNESFIIVLRFWAKTAAKRPLPPRHQPNWRLPTPQRGPPVPWWPPGGAARPY